MPTPKLKSHERRRCVKACSRCKRRKERCDGLHPCRRCLSSGVGYECSIAQPSLLSASLAEGRRLARDVSPERFNGSLPDPEPMDLPELEPEFNNGPRTCSVSSASLLDDSIANEPQIPSHLLEPPAATVVPQTSQLIQDCRGTLFIGNAATLAFHQAIRRLVVDSLGNQLPADAPLRHDSVDQSPQARSASSWAFANTRRPPPKPDLLEVDYLIGWYLSATNCVAYLFDELELRNKLLLWLQLDQEEQERDAGTSAACFLILAVGAQGCPENMDATAEQYFSYGKFLTLSRLMDEPTISTIQAHILIVVYLLGASRQKAASMYLGTAVRTAYELGIHRIDINKQFEPPEFVFRERLWRTLRILDLFFAASLGRSPSTHEARNTEDDAYYSASNDLCNIFDVILNQVYSKSKVPAAVVERVCQYHRRWAARYPNGLDYDKIPLGEMLHSREGKAVANVNFYGLMVAYYWTVMLLTRPFLIESISRHQSRAADRQAGSKENAAFASPTRDSMSYACIDSAIRTVDLLGRLLLAEGVPKRLPVLVNCLFAAALVLGLAQFGDLDCSFPIREKLDEARAHLAVFSSSDAVAMGDRAIVENLQASCHVYADNRERHKMERHSLLFSRLFGTVDDFLHVQVPSPVTIPVKKRRRLGGQRAIEPAPAADSPDSPKPLDNSAHAATCTHLEPSTDWG